MHNEIYKKESFVSKCAVATQTSRLCFNILSQFHFF